MPWAVLPALAALIVAAPFLREWLRRPMDASARRDAPGDFADLPQGLTHFRWSGPADGPVVVCVHGLTTPSFVWHGLDAPLAARGYRVLIYDLYGRGYSDRPSGAQTPAFHIRQLTDLLVDQGIDEEIILLGHSMGGAIATRFAAAHPDRIRRLVLLTPAGIAITVDAMTRFILRTPVVGDWLMLAFYARQHRSYTEAERPLPSSVPGIVDLQQRELQYRGYIPSILSSMRGLIGTRLRSEHEALCTAKVSVTAIWGEIDPVIPLSAKDRLAEWNPNAHQRVIPAGGHGIPYNNSDAVLKILDDTL